jgi:hypothetical protein
MTKTRPVAPLEEDECRWLMHWASTQRWQGYKLTDLLLLIPNGAYHGADRAVGAVVARKLRAKGLKSGASDYLLAVPDFAKSCAGLWLEMKRTSGSKTSEDQRIFMATMTKLGYKCTVARGWIEASQQIGEYLSTWGKL